MTLAMSWLRPVFSICAGMWLASHYRMDIWIWGFIFSYAILVTIHTVWITAKLIAFTYKWHTQKVR